MVLRILNCHSYMVLINFVTFAPFTVCDLKCVKTKVFTPKLQVELVKISFSIMYAIQVKPYFYGGLIII